MARRYSPDLRFALAGAALLLSAAVQAIEGGAVPESTINPELLQIDEAAHLGDPLPRELSLIDAQGREFTVADMFGKPVILLFSYYTCDGTCPTINKNLRKALARIDRFRIGEDYRVLTVSFDKQDTFADAAHFAHMAEIPPEMQSGWRHAVLKRPETDIDTLTRGVGFNFFWSRADKVFLHPNVVVFLTPDGRVARYLYGINIDAETVKLALIDADWGRISNTTQLIDILSGVCYSYNFKEGRYNYNYSVLFGGLSMLFGVSLVIFSTTGFKSKKFGRLSHV